MQLWISIILATLIVQIPNIWAIQIFEKDPSFKQALIVGVWFIPFSIFSTAFFAYYYGMAFHKHISYPVIAVAAYGVSMVCSIVIQQFILKNKTILTVDYVGMFFMILGLLIIIFRTNINNWIKGM